MMRDLDPFDITVQKPQTFCAKEFCGAEISAVLTCFNRDLIQGMGLTSPKSAEAWEEDFGLSKACFFFFCGLLCIGIGDAAWGVDASFFSQSLD